MAAKVFVRGFDFGTTEEQIQAHCSTVGPVASLEKWGSGSAVVEFETPELAQAAVDQLNKTTIEGNTRFIDVKLDLKSKEEKPKGFAVKQEQKGKGAAFKRSAPAVAGSSARVFVRGFDFGTTDEQLEGHMSSAGTLQKVQWCSKGAAIVTYSTIAEAEAAVSQLNQTTIEGNSRFIDVLMKEPDDAMPPAAKRAKFAPVNAAPVVTRGKGGTWVFMPDSMPASKMLAPAVGKGIGKGGKSGKSGKSGKGREDPPGSGRVFIRGFEYNTTDEQVLSHMSSCGEIETIHWVSKGSAVVVYKKKASAKAASIELHQSIIEGNTRYIDVMLKDSE